MQSHPRISIVTPSLNQGSFLEQTIDSVLSQGYPNLEYIIIDGGSTDNSVEIIKKHSKHLAYWVSEKDSGQSNAINKGIRRITGDVFNWLCSDDYLEAGALRMVGEAFRHPSVHCFAGELRKFNSQGTLGTHGPMLKESLEETLISRVIKQPAVFYSADAVNKMGLLNEQLHYCMDVDWFWKFMLHYGTENIKEESSVVAHYRIHDSSKSGAFGNRFLTEDNSIMYYLARSGNLKAYQQVLEKKQILPALDFPDDVADRFGNNTIEKIVFNYLLRTAVLVFSKQDFEFAKAVAHIPVPEGFPLNETRKKQLTFLSENIKNRNWAYFRIKRAIKWRMSKTYLKP